VVERELAAIPKWCSVHEALKLLVVVHILERIKVNVR
jgi:hypothetical protein